MAREGRKKGTESSSGEKRGRRKTWWCPVIFAPGVVVVTYGCKAWSNKWLLCLGAKDTIRLFQNNQLIPGLQPVSCNI